VHKLNSNQNLIPSKFNVRSALKRVDDTKIMTELRSASNVNSVQAWLSLVQRVVIVITTAG